MSPDMEDLLRKASENYPLKQAEDRWNEIASRIKAVSPPASQNKSRNRYLGTLLLLLMFLFLGVFILKPPQNNKLGKKELVKKNVALKKNAAQTKELLPKNDNHQIMRVSPEPGVSYINSIKRNGAETKSNRNSSLKYPIDATLNAGDRQKKINATSDWINETAVNTRLNKNTGKMETITPEPIHETINTLHPKTYFFDIADEFLSSVLSKKHKNANNLFSGKGRYFGLLAGPGFNTVKNQGLKKAGLNIGFLGGYRFGRNFSLETGLLLSQKFYSTSGDFFSKKLIGPAMPPSMKVKEVDGSTRVIEMPVSLRYDILKNKKQNFFSSAGFSSYLVDKESNRYHTSLNGIEEMAYATYKNNRSYFASSINLSIGYEQNIGKKNTIRFQPYIQLPVKGIGVGDLQVMSTGLYIGIIR